MTNNCFTCRKYFDPEWCDKVYHTKRIRAKTLNGWFYWGPKAKKMPGRWVMICLPCKKALQES